MAKVLLPRGRFDAQIVQAYKREYAKTDGDGTFVKYFLLLNVLGQAVKSNFSSEFLDKYYQQAFNKPMKLNELVGLKVLASVEPDTFFVQEESKNVDYNKVTWVTFLDNQGKPIQYAKEFMNNDVKPVLDDPFKHTPEHLKNVRIKPV